MRGVRCVRRAEVGGRLTVPLDVPILAGVRPAPQHPGASGPSVEVADGTALSVYRRLRRESFVAEQSLFVGSDADDLDDDPRTVVLVAHDADGGVVGGVRLAPVGVRDIGWWTGSRLVVAPGVRGGAGIGSALVAAACRTVVARGVLRFDAAVQERYRPMFLRLGWEQWGTGVIGGVPHASMRFPIDRIRSLVTATKAALAEVLDPFGASWGDAPAGSLGGRGYVGDDGAPVPGTDVIAACDAILPAMIERDPEWAGWCGVLVNLNDLAAMGAAPAGLLNAVAGRDASFVRRVMGGLRSGADAWGVPLLGGHTQIGVAPALAVTALGRTDRPVRGGGGGSGDDLTVTVDTAGGWRPGAGHTQWDSSSARTGAELRALGHLVADAAPKAAKDVSMAGIVGTAGMLAEACGSGAIVDVDRVPTPDGAAMGDWLTCFPGFGMLTADRPGASRMGSPLTVTAHIGSLTVGTGVRLRWPDGETTTALPGAATGLGPA